MCLSLGRIPARHVIAMALPCFALLAGATGCERAAPPATPNSSQAPAPKKLDSPVVFDSFSATNEGASAASTQPPAQPPAPPPPQPPPPPQASTEAPTADRAALEQRLAELDAQIKAAPDDIKLRMTRAKTLSKLGRYDDAESAAKEVMAICDRTGNSLAWIIIDQIDVDGNRVDVHFNMGPRERHPPPDGIVRPYSFRIWAPGPEIKMVDAIDFELGYLQGQPQTAAFGKSTSTGHSNYGMATPDMTYSKIRPAAIALITKRI